ncbi:uncharacterized protein TM35_000471230 [Trypanosoma theileri]|uniref:Mucin-associated surface protein (MASP) n=1 Tax=Trypanosoma theileri TaxID=67003 RepID=A0A1X0NI79_9TRYP|nr:uncharacterized protein TM35_000471230 [Trypanosoma theileri]ORC84228.1 hypothetical protein TM35_000471230 [Trypanosoma theileri]
MMQLHYVFCIFTLLLSCTSVCVLAEDTAPEGLGHGVTSCSDVSDGTSKPPCTRENPGGGLGAEESHQIEQQKLTVLEERDVKNQHLEGKLKQEELTQQHEAAQEDRVPQSDHRSTQPAAAVSRGTGGVDGASQPGDHVTENPVDERTANTLTGRRDTAAKGLETPVAQHGGKENVEVQADASVKTDEGPSQNGPHDAPNVNGPSHSATEPSTSNTRTSDNTDTTQTNVTGTAEGQDTSVPTTQSTGDVFSTNTTTDATSNNHAESETNDTNPAEGESTSEESTTTTKATLPPELTINKKGDTDSSSSISSSVWVRVALLIVVTLACILVC